MSKYLSCEKPNITPYRKTKESPLANSCVEVE